MVNMYGNEVVGRELFFLLVEFLCLNYGYNNWIIKFIDIIRIYLLFLMNLDGWESFKEGDCSSVRGWFNVNGVDLNCNFFDLYDG